MNIDQRNNEREGQKGAAMIAVLCIMSIFLFLAFALLLSAAALNGAGKGRIPGEKCKIMAVSLSNVITRALEAEGEENDLQKLVHEEMEQQTWPQISDRKTAFAVLGDTDGEMTKNKEKYGNEIRSLEVTDVPQDYRVEIAMAWEQIEEQEEFFPGRRLYAAVICSLRGETYRLKSTYILTETDETEWRWNLEWRE